MTAPTITSGPIRFHEMPHVGHIHVYRDQLYFLVEVSTVKKSLPLTWKSHCCDCGEPFNVASNAKGGSGFSRRCEPHRQRGKRVRQWQVNKKALGYHDVKLANEHWDIPKASVEDGKPKTYEPATLKEKIHNHTKAKEAMAGKEAEPVKEESRPWTAENTFEVLSVGSIRPTGGIMTQAVFDRIVSQCVARSILYKVIDNKVVNGLW